MSSSMKKSTQFTVFVRFHPPHESLRRHHTEQWFAGVGPIKKSSLIHQDNKVFGFIKYTCQEDAEKAAKEYDGQTFSVDGGTVQVQMALAQDAAANTSASSTTATTASMTTAEDEKKPHEKRSSHQDTHEVYRKKACRLILRNLAFAATEKDIRKALTPFGPLAEVHIPTVTGAPTHRGFAFVTFENLKDANQCLSESETILIKKRNVKIAHSLNKAEFDLQKQRDEEPNKRKKQIGSTDPSKDNKAKVDDSKNDDDASEDEEGDDSGDNNSSDDSSEASSDASDQEDDDDASKHSKEDADKQTSSSVVPLSEKRTIFIRNLPFDATRHDLFELLRKFGKIESIYVCKAENGIAKGTAFLNYAKPAAAQRAIRAADTRIGSEKPEDEGEVATVGTGVLLNGRQLMIDLAVDKETASTLTLDKKQAGGGKDRRHMYLRTEGRVDDQVEWEALPESDKEKRQRAWTEKNTKLKSPIFFINATRLSIRNLAKHVDESGLKKLVVEATMKGLENNLVTAQDQIALWKAKGDMSNRDILTRIQEIDEGDDPNKSIVPAFDPANVKRYIPSVFVDRDFTRGNPKEAPSRGFGFVQFEHHVHALACLRELNNNTAYTEKFVTGGSSAFLAKRKVRKSKIVADAETSGLIGSDGQVKLPRLIVEFTVENKVKAKHQVEHRAHQQANVIKQKMEKKVVSKKEKKRARGARQRENRRKAPEDDGIAEERNDRQGRTNVKESDDIQATVPAPIPKSVKPPKKKAKVDASESKFNDLVESYKKSFTADTVDADTSADKPKRRWYE